MPPKRKPLADRLWPRINKNGPIPEYRPDLGPCWIWQGSTVGDGYGNIGTGGKFGPRARAHRVSYELIKGPIPDGLTLDHLCRVRACCNPDHLEPVTLEENKRRGFSPPAINARRDHTKCIHGHAYRHPTDRKRGCTTCRIEWNRKHAKA